MSETLAFSQLVARQSELSESIANAAANLAKFGGDSINDSAVEIRLAQLRENWREFKDNHTRLRSMTLGMSEIKHSERVDYFGGNRYSDIEEKFLKSATCMAGLLKAEVPSFSGEFADWLEFKDAFTAAIIQNDRLTSVEKLQRLKTHVRGNAAKILGPIQVMGGNLDNAWEKLGNHYDNPRKLVDAHISILMNLPPMASESASELEALYYATINALSALKQLNRPVDSWDDIVVALTAGRFDRQTRYDWEFSLGTSTECPTFKQLTDYIKGKIGILEAVEMHRASERKVRSIQEELLYYQVPSRR